MEQLFASPNGMVGRSDEGSAGRRAPPHDHEPSSNNSNVNWHVMVYIYIYNLMVELLVIRTNVGYSYVFVYGVLLLHPQHLSMQKGWLPLEILQSCQHGASIFRENGQKEYFPRPPPC